MEVLVFSLRYVRFWMETDRWVAGGSGWKIRLWDGRILWSGVSMVP